jgi:hypothetical protein
MFSDMEGLHASQSWSWNLEAGVFFHGSVWSLTLVLARGNPVLLVTANNWKQTSTKWLLLMDNMGAFVSTDFLIYF